MEARREERIATIWADTALVWQDTLFHLQLQPKLKLITPRVRAIIRPLSKWIGFNWTGAEELLLGELQPREIAEAGLPGALFTEPRFSAAGPGYRWRNPRKVF